MITTARLKRLENQALKHITAKHSQATNEYIKWLNTLSDEEVEEVYVRMLISLSAIGFAPEPPTNLSELCHSNAPEFSAYLKECSEWERREIEKGRFLEAEEVTTDVWQAYRAEGHPQNPKPIDPVYRPYP